MPMVWAHKKNQSINNYNVYRLQKTCDVEPDVSLRRLRCRNPCRDPQPYSTSAPNRRRQKSVAIADDADNKIHQKPRVEYIEAGKGTKNEQETKRRTRQK